METNAPYKWWFLPGHYRSKTGRVYNTLRRLHQSILSNHGYRVSNSIVDIRPSFCSWNTFWLLPQTLQWHHCEILYHSPLPASAWKRSLHFYWVFSLSVDSNCLMWGSLRWFRGSVFDAAYVSNSSVRLHCISRFDAHHISLISCSLQRASVNGQRYPPTKSPLNCQPRCCKLNLICDVLGCLTFPCSSYISRSFVSNSGNWTVVQHGLCRSLTIGKADDAKRYVNLCRERTSTSCVSSSIT